MSRAFPCLYIKDYDNAKDFYVAFLSFEIMWEWRHEPGFPVYMGISRKEGPGITEGDVTIHLTEHREVPEGIGILIDVEDVQAFYDDLKTRRPDLLEAHLDVREGKALLDQAWGKTELQLRDPFGNHLTFTSPTPDA